MIGVAEHFKRDRVALTTVTTIGAFIIAVAAYVFTTSVKHEHTRLLTAASDYAASLSHTSQEHLLRIFKALDRNSIEIADAYLDKKFAPDELHVVLRMILARDDIAVQLAIIDAYGTLAATSVVGNSGAGSMDLKDREHFRAHLDPTAPSPFISKPLIGRASGQWSIQYTRRIASESGEFLGVAVVSFNPFYLSKFYEGTRIGKHGEITLLALDGTILARSNDPDRFLGKPNPELPIGDLANASAVGLFTWESPLDGIERVTSYRKISGFPMVVLVGVATADIFEEFDSYVVANLFNLILTMVAVALIILVLWHYLKSLRSARARDLERFSEERRAEYFAMVMSIPGTYVVSLTASGTIATANPAFLNIFGKPELLDVLISGLIGSKWPATVDPFDLRTAIGVLPKSFAITIYAGRMQEKVIDWTFSEFDTGANGFTKALLGIGLDTTAHRKAQAEAFQNAKLATLGQMATGVAHEINQPLNVIQLTSENLRGRIEKLIPGNQDLLSRVDKIKRQITRISRIIDHMRIFGRKSSLRPQLVDTNDAIDEVLSMFEPELRIADVRLQRNLSSPPAFVIADITLLVQVLLNLLMNARDAIVLRRTTLKTADFKGRIELSVVRQPGGMVAIIVGDNGGGIPSEAIEHVFEPFFTTKGADAGTGLGLSISYSIVDALGGTLTVSNSEQGAVFTIRLPSPSQRDVVIEPKPTT